MTIKLRSIGGTHAVFYRAGQRVGDSPLDDGTLVTRPTEIEMADAPAVLPEIAEVGCPDVFLTSTGVFMVPGRGLAVIFGAEPLEEAAAPLTIGGRVRRVITGEEGEIVSVEPGGEGAVHANSETYTVRWDAGGQPEGGLGAGQIEPV